MSKYPSHLHTIVVYFGPNVPPMQQHHSDRLAAGRILSTLVARMKATEGRCIERIELWHRNSLTSSYIANPPNAVWLPPKDANGVRHIPEGGLKRRPPRIINEDLSELTL